MVFYFSGTGNSKYAAELIAHQTNDTIVSIADELEKDKCSYELKPNEKVGFVFPTYYYGIPTVVSDFLQKLKINTNNNYTYLVLTCGGDIAKAYGVFEKSFTNKLNGIYSVKMPDNYVILYEVSTVEQQKMVLNKAEEKIQNISAKINSLFNGKYELDNSKLSELITPVLYATYSLFRKTKKFYADENCNGCGLCASNCPENVIEIINGKPKWNKIKCSHCTSCINRCPKQAVQYGKKTENRHRYYIDKILS